VSVETLVIETLALSEAELCERVASLEADVAVYHELICAAFDAVRTLTVQNQHLQESYRRQQDENRALREETLLKCVPV
jgi:hypothetical protein